MEFVEKSNPVRTTPSGPESPRKIAPVANEEPACATQNPVSLASRKLLPNIVYRSMVRAVAF